MNCKRIVKIHNSVCPATLSNSFPLSMEAAAAVFLEIAPNGRTRRFRNCIWAVGKQTHISECASVENWVQTAAGGDNTYTF
jgi:hypothetical protein